MSVDPRAGVVTRPSERLLSLDVFRGITIAGMILVNSPGNQTAYAPLEHAEWNGLTPTDLVFPFFVFILGVSLVFSFAKRRESGHGDRQLILQIVRRTAIIFGSGLLLNGFPYYHLSTLRIPGVLQRIAICYFFAAVLYLRLNLKSLLILTVGLLVGYWLLMTRIPVPGFGVGDLSKEGNLAAYIDRLLLHGHTYTPDYDPEGILSTLPAIATALIGVLTGRWLMRKDKTPHEKAVGLLCAGIVGLLVGEIWNRWFPINKALWTSSYILFTAGAGLVLLAICYWLIEIKGIRGWSKFFEVFGVNAILAYVLSILDLKIQNRIPIANPDGTAGNLRLFITHHLFGWTSDVNASLLYALCHTLLWFFILRWLYRKRIFFKI
jgi:predicted acyltransferase